jgi:hypothetical protein
LAAVSSLRNDICGTPIVPQRCGRETDSERARMNPNSFVHFEITAAINADTGRIVLKITRTLIRIMKGTCFCQHMMPVIYSK